MSKSLGTLTLDLVAKVGGFEQGLDKAARKSKQSMSEVEKSVDLAKKALVGLAGALSVRAITSFASAQLDAADAIGKSAEVANLTTDSLQELRYAFTSLANVADRDVDAALRRFNRRLGLARDGAGPAKQAFESMFGGVDQFATTEQALDAVIQRIAAMEDQSLRAAAASAYFGDDAGPLLAAALGHGSKAIDDLRKSARDLGLVLDRDLVASAADVKTEFDNLSQVIGTQLMRAVTNLSPMLMTLADGAVLLAENTDKIAIAAGVVGSVLAARMVSGLVETAAQTAFNIQQNIAYQATLARMAGRSYAAAAAATALRDALALVGGPMGVAVLAATAIGAWALSTRDAAEDTENLQDRVDRLTGSMDNLRAREIEAAIEAVTEKMREQQEIIAKSSAALQSGVGRAAAQHQAHRDAIAAANEELDKQQQNLWKLEEQLARIRANQSGELGVSGPSDEVLKRYEQLAANLAQQIALYGDVSEVAKVRYEIEHGNLQGLNEEQRKHLEGLAAELDALEIRAEREQELAALRELIGKQADERRQSELEALDLEKERYEQQIENLRAFREEELLTDEEYYELAIAAYAEHQHRLTEISEEEAQKRAKAEQDAQAMIRGMHTQTWQLASGLLQNFSGESKAVALAVVAINKGLMAAQTIQNTAAAVMRAMTIDPTGALAAKVSAMGKVQLGIIAASGLAEAVNIGSAGAPAGSPANPIATTPAQPTVPDLGEQRPPQAQELIVRRESSRPVWTDDEVSSLIDQINERAEDGAVIKIFRAN